jgi:hypothetical protein
VILRRLAPVATAASFALAGCGDDDSSSGTSARSESGGTATALREVGETRDALQAALATYEDGDAAAAEEQVAEAYVSHFEEVEEALEQRDHELNESLEEQISRDLRADMKADKPVVQVRRSVEAVIADLGKAEAALR